MKDTEHKKGKYQNIAIVLALVVGGMYVGTVWQPWEARDTTDAIFSRDVVSYEIVQAQEESDEAVVKYEYKGEKVPEKLAPDEDVTKRTESSYTREVAIENKGTKEEKKIYEAVFYTQPTYHQEGNDWYFVEHATTTKTAFYKAQEEKPLASLFWKKAHAASISPFAGAGDGRVQNTVLTGDCGGSTWASAHDATTGTTVNYTDTILHSYVQSVNSSFLSLYACSITRAFLPFDTSSIPSGASISSASLNMYIVNVYDADNDGEDFMTVVQTSQASHTTLATADYDMCGTISNPTEGIDTGTRKDLTSVSSSAYLSFSFNATGRGWINMSGGASTCTATTGITCLGVREGHDVLNSRIAYGVDASYDNGLDISSSEASGTSQDPYLSVTYTVPTFAPWKMWEF